MKTIERLLAELNALNKNEVMEKIQLQIKHFLKSRMEVEGISLMTIRDSIDASITDKMLRDNGYILNVSQFVEDSEKFLNLAMKDPITYNPLIKRLHRGYILLKDQYVKGQVSNKVVADELSKRFSDAMLDIFCGKSDTQKMPKELSNRIAKMIDSEIDRLNENWITNKLSQETKKEFNDLLSTQILKDWQKGTLDANVSKVLQEEKNQLNSVDELLMHFRNVKLPEDLQSGMSTAVIDEIVKDINAGKIVPNSALGSEINLLRHNSLRTENFTVLSELLANWQSSKTSSEVSKQLEKYIVLVINKMKGNLESRLTNQFDQLATQIFTEKLRAGEYNNPELLNIIGKHTLSIAKQLLLSGDSENSCVSKCKEAIHNDVMVQLHDDWIHGRLSQAENPFIELNVFKFLDEIDHKIQQTVWFGDSKSALISVMDENKKLRQEVSQLSQLFSKLMSSNNIDINKFNTDDSSTKNVGFFATPK